MSKFFIFIGVLLLMSAVGLLAFQQLPAQQDTQENLDSLSSSGEPKILRAIFTENCAVEISTGTGTFSFPTSFDPEIAKCEKYSVVAVSPSGGFAAFEDLSSTGVDAIVRLYDLTNNRLFTLDDYGTESVLNILFLPNNRLLVLYSQGISGKQSLRLYDVPSLEPFLADIEPESDISTETLNRFVFEHNLDDATGVAKAIRLTGDSVVLVDENDDIANPLFSISLSEL